MAAEDRGVAVGVVRVTDVEGVAAPTAQPKVVHVNPTVVEVAVSAITVRRTEHAIAATRLVTWPRTAASACLPTTGTMSVVVAEEEEVVALLRDSVSHVMME